VARLESLARAGYWPTPPRVAHAIARHLAPAEDRRRHVARLLDPCAGTGEAAAVVAQALGAESFGIELNTERAAAARGRLDRVLATSAFTVRLANGAFSCLYLNPPYAQDDAQRRLEHAFLTAMTRALCPGGVLVFLVPQPRLPVSARYLAAHYEAFRVHRFPDPECGAFRQVVLLATRKARPVSDGSAQTQLETWAGADLPPLPDEPAGAPLRVPAVPAGEVLFASLIFDPREAAAEARVRGVWAQPQLAEQLWPPEETSVRPLMPLRKGHLALLIAAGFLDNVLLEQDGHRALVKGRTRKAHVRVEGSDPDTVVEREVLRTTIAVLDLRSGALEAIEQGGGADKPLTGGPA
jgi:SAM-dependent methyltransferase